MLELFLLIAVLRQFDCYPNEQLDFHKASRSISANSPTTPSSFRNQEHVLFQKLLENYDSTARPVVNHTMALKVILSMKLYQILELSEKEQSLTTNIWIEQVNFNI